MGRSPEPRWLTEEEQQTWIVLASTLMRLPAALDDQLRRDAGVSHFEYQVLSGLSMAPGRTMRMSQLATYSAGSLARLSQVVGRLEKRGWVRRTPDPDDGRYTLAILTEDGWRAVEKAAPGHVEAVRTFVFDPLTTAQTRALTTAARRMLTAIDDPPACPDRLP